MLPLKPHLPSCFPVRKSIRWRGGQPTRAGMVLLFFALPVAAQHADSSSGVPSACNIAGLCPDDNPLSPRDFGDLAERLGPFLEDMEANLLSAWFEGFVCDRLEFGQPGIVESGGDIIVSAPVLRVVMDGESFTGQAMVSWSGAERTMALEIAFDSGQRHWRLTQEVDAGEGWIAAWGDVTLTEIPIGTTTLAGGWLYTHEGGPALLPGSDAGYEALLGEMFGCPTAGAAGSASWLSDALSMLGNGLSNLINFWRDARIPWKNPTSCLGPIVASDTGQSCADGAVKCEDDLADMCKSIKDLPTTIPGVTTAFKKCMKGRCGCGGSTFPRLKVSCAPSDDCGPCTIAGGCSTFGSKMWYCKTNEEFPSLSTCRCVDTVFHEMAHSCGMSHSVDYFQNPNCSLPGNSACDVGEWFADEFDELYPEAPGDCAATGAGDGGLLRSWRPGLEKGRAR